jgi:hypothetical protein
MLLNDYLYGIAGLFAHFGTMTSRPDDIAGRAIGIH